MNIAALLAMLIQAGVCAPTAFQAKDGATLSVAVCPVLQAPPGADDQTKPSEPSDAPKGKPV